MSTCLEASKWYRFRDADDSATIQRRPISRGVCSSFEDSPAAITLSAMSLSQKRKGPLTRRKQCRKKPYAPGRMDVIWQMEAEKCVLEDHARLIEEKKVC
jgi:hypothetical protein